MIDPLAETMLAERPSSLILESLKWLPVATTLGLFINWGRTSGFDVALNSIWPIVFGWPISVLLARKVCI